MLVHHRIPSIKQLGVLLLLLVGTLVHHRVPSIEQLGVLLLLLVWTLVHHRVPLIGNNKIQNRSIHLPIERLTLNAYHCVYRYEAQ